MKHLLKTWVEPFSAIRDGYKRHEFRFENDRLFVEGDTLILQEFEHCNDCDATGHIKRPHGGIEVCPRCLCEKGKYTGEELSCEVTYVGRAPAFGIPKGAVVMTIRLPGDVFATEHKKIATRQYYYRINECHAPDNADPKCICWFDEGTGPLAGCPEMILAGNWRVKPQPPQSNEPPQS